MTQHRSDNAEPLLHKALANAQLQAGESSSANVATILMLLALVFACRGQYAKARPILAKAVAITNRLVLAHTPLAQPCCLSCRTWSSPSP